MRAVRTGARWLFVEDAPSAGDESGIGIGGEVAVTMSDSVRTWESRAPDSNYGWPWGIRQPRAILRRLSIFWRNA